MLAAPWRPKGTAPARGTVLQREAFRAIGDSMSKLTHTNCYKHKRVLFKPSGTQCSPQAVHAIGLSCQCQLETLAYSYAMAIGEA